MLHWCLHENTHTSGGSDGIRAGYEGLAVVQADKHVHAPGNTHIILCLKCFKQKTKENKRTVHISFRATWQ